MNIIIEKFKFIQFNSPVILTYTALSFTILIFDYLTLGKTNKYFFTVYRSKLSNPLTYVRIFGHALGHIGFNHYFSNFMLILLVGPMLEEKYGSVIMLTMILITAFVTGIIFLIASKNTSLCGASGVAFMMILLSSYANFANELIPLTLILVVVTYIGREVYQGITSKDNVSHITHIIGGLCGTALGYYINMFGIRIVSSTLRDIYTNMSKFISR